MTTPVPPWQGYVEFVANPLRGDFVPPVPTGLIALGDSRIQFSGGLPTPGGGALLSDSLLWTGYYGPLVNAINNVVRASFGSNYGVTSSTSLSGQNRAVSASNAAVGNPANAAPPAGTGQIADAKFSVVSMGQFSPVNHPSNLVLIVDLINDIGNAYFTTLGGGNNTLGIMISAAALYDTFAFANKVLFVGESPKGKSTFYAETHGVVAGSFAATNAAGFVGGTDFPTPVAEVVTAAGAVLVKTSGVPGPGQFNRVGNVYTVDAGLNGTNVYVTYCSGALGQTTATMLDVNEWLQSSSPSPFVAPTSGNSYPIAGARFGRPWVVYFDMWGALLDSGTGDAKNGLLSDGLHPGHAGSSAIQAPFLAAFSALYPSVATNLRPIPTLGNQEMGNTGGAIHYTSPGGLGGGVAFASTLFDTANPPPAAQCRFTYGTGLSAGPSVVTITDLANGFYRCSGGNLDPTKNGPDAAPTGNFINTATGAWDLFFLASTVAPIYFERDWSNFFPNALLESNHGTGGKTAAITGTAPGNVTVSCGDTQLGLALTVAMSFGVDPVSGKPVFIVDVNGLAGTGGGLNLTALRSVVLNRIIPANNPLACASILCILQAGSNGHLYGVNGAGNSESFTVGGGATRGTYTGITNIGEDTSLGTASLPMTDADLDANGQLVKRVLSSPMDLSSPVTLTAAAVLRYARVTWEINKPVSFRAMFTEATFEIL